MHAHAQAYRGGAAAAARAICACACRSRTCASGPSAVSALPSAPTFFAQRAMPNTTASATATTAKSSAVALAMRTLPVSRSVVARVLMSGRDLSSLSSCSSGPARRAFGSNDSRVAAAAEAAEAADAARFANPFASDEELLAAFDAAWDEHVSKLKEHGHWSETSSDGAALSAAGALKHANLKFARSRQDAIFSVDAAKVSALLGPPLPYVDRKTTNSSKRLLATFVDGKDLGDGEGGPARTEDLARVVLAARFGASAQRAAAAAARGGEGGEEVGEGADAEEAAAAPGGDDLLTGRTLKSPAYLAAAIELLPELARVMAAEPDPAAAARAAEAAEQAEAARATAFAERQAAAQALQVGEGRYGGGGERFGDRRRNDRFGDRRSNDRFGDRRGGSDSRFGDRRSNDRYEPPEPAAMRPGDWRCPSCDAHNFAARDACFRCGTLPDPAVAAEAREALAASRAASAARRFERNGSGEGGEQVKREGDWDCEGCGSSNFSWRGSCYRCGGDRPASAGPIPERSAPSSSSYGRERSFGDRGDRFERRAPSPGDWFCGSCGRDNFARRDSCFSCGTPRAADARIVPGDPRGAAGGSSFGDRRPPRQVSEGGGPPPPREGDWPCPDCGFSNFASRASCFRCGGGRPASAGPIPERRSYGGGGGGGYGERREGGYGGGGYQRRDGGGGGGRGYGRSDRGGSNWSSSSSPGGGGVAGSPPPAPVDLDWD